MLVKNNSVAQNATRNLHRLVIFRNIEEITHGKNHSAAQPGTRNFYSLVISKNTKNTVPPSGSWDLGQAGGSLGGCGACLGDEVYLHF